jgi:CheY-specific phosphatase CheX
MPAIGQLSEPFIRDNIVHAVADVLDETLRRPISLRDWAGPWPPRPSAKPASATPQVVGTVGFLGGARGLVQLYFESALAVDCAGAMLGMDGPELESVGDVVVDYAIGELTNMIVDVFKNGLCDAGYPCGLTESSILRGLNFRIDPIVTQHRYIYVFDCAGRRIVADIVISGEAPDRPAARSRVSPKGKRNRSRWTRGSLR